MKSRTFNLATVSPAIAGTACSVHACQWQAIGLVEESTERLGVVRYNRRRKLCPVHLAMYSVRHLSDDQRDKAWAILFPLTLHKSGRPKPAPVVCSSGTVMQRIDWAARPIEEVLDSAMEHVPGFNWRYTAGRRGSLLPHMAVIPRECQVRVRVGSEVVERFFLVSVNGPALNRKSRSTIGRAVELAQGGQVEEATRIVAVALRKAG